ncbi:hypothetical protein RSAG8_05141, partial [Rhizoctonia solani AG-8 WAC10335]
MAVLKAIIQNLPVSPNKLPKDDTSDIFQVASDGLCAHRQPIRVEVARALKKGKLDGVVQESSQGHAPDHDWRYSTPPLHLRIITLDLLG